MEQKYFELDIEVEESRNVSKSHGRLNDRTALVADVRAKLLGGDNDPWMRSFERSALTKSKLSREIAAAINSDGKLLSAIGAGQAPPISASIAVNQPVKNKTCDAASSIAVLELQNASSLRQESFKSVATTSTKIRQKLRSFFENIHEAKVERFREITRQLLKDKTTSGGFSSCGTI